MSGPRLRRVRRNGVALIALLIFIAVSMLALSAMVTVWTTVAQREREAQLLFVGKQYRQAIESYFKSTPGAGQLPQKLEDLLEDTRTGVLKRHLRKLYRDPMTGEANWGLVRVGERIAGVYSVSQAVPFKVSGLDDLPGAETAASYQDWKFVFAGATTPAAAGAGQVAGGGVPPGPGTGLPAVGGQPTPPEPSPLTRQACDRQRQLEMQECNGVRGYAGVTNDEVQECLASTADRYGFCLQGLGARAPALAIPELERPQ